MIPSLKNRFIALIFALVVLIGMATAVQAQSVDPLPDDNLLQNPWFRAGDNPSLEQWTDAAGSNAIWSLSQKQSNPTPDQVMGTSARLAFGSGQGGGIGQGGVDAYLYQVVAADPTQTHLQFKIHWVTQWIDSASVTIFGGPSEDGPWTAVWVPLEVDQRSSSGGAWAQTELLDTTLPQGYPFYKVELFGRYPEGRQQGAKFTGVYFAVDGNAGEIGALPSATEPADEPEPIAGSPEETAVPPTSTAVPEIEPTAEPETAVAEANTPAPQPTERPARPTRAPLEPTEIPAEAASGSRGPSGIYLIIIAGLMLLVIVLGIGWARAARQNRINY